jgi:hypothetical protein
MVRGWLTPPHQDAYEVIDIITVNCSELLKDFEVISLNVL